MLDITITITAKTARIIPKIIWSIPSTVTPVGILPLGDCENRGLPHPEQKFSSAVNSFPQEGQNVTQYEFTPEIKHLLKENYFFQSLFEKIN